MYQFVTSCGVVKFDILSLVPCSWTENDDGSITENYHYECEIVEGKEALDDKYKWVSASIYTEKPGWVQIHLDDGYYGSPEYPFTPV